MIKIIRQWLLTAALLMLLVRSHASIEAASWLKESQGARSTAMGGAFGAVAGSIEGLWYNPAGIGMMESAQVHFNHYQWDFGFASNHLALGLPIGRNVNIGVMVDRRGSSDTFRDSFGKASGEFPVNSLAAGLAFAWSNRYVSLGVSGKVLDETIASVSASSGVGDAGVIVRPFPGYLSMGVAVQNLGSAPDVGEQAGGVLPPVILRAGLAIAGGKAVPGLMITQEVRRLVALSRVDYHAGVEYSIRAGHLEMALRGGWDEGRSDLGGSAGMTFGAGLGWNGLVFDYAYAPLEIFGEAHRISATWMLNFLSEPARALDLAPRQKTSENLSTGGVAFELGRPPGDDTADNINIDSTGAVEVYRGGLARDRMRQKNNAVPTTGPIAGQPGGVSEIASMESMHKGERLEREGQPVEAEKAYIEACRLDPDNKQAWSKLGMFYYNRRRPAEAIEAFEQVDRIKPTAEFRDWLDRYRKRYGY